MLTQLIRQAIQFQGSFTSFDEFMDLALYYPDLGFYMNPNQKFGKTGSFVTAPEISPLFAECIAKQCQQISSTLPDYDFLELGAGSGIFAKDLLLSLEKLSCLPQHYFIVEKSPHLREAQQQFLKTHCAHLFSRITWLDKLSSQKITGIIFANEVLDALPVTCFEIKNHEICERSVAFKKENFSWELTDPSDKLFSAVEQIQKDCELPANYQSEINFNLKPFLKKLSETLTQGVILFFDYGYGRREYYHPERSQGTLTCFYQHQKTSNPFENIGAQDITAHVDFTSVIEKAVDAGLKLKGFTTQAAFLLNCGLLELANNNRLTEAERFKENQAIKTLTLPTEMGETIKVIGLEKNFSAPLLGFSFHDRSRDL